jgi:hypothetical protein
MKKLLAFGVAGLLVLLVGSIGLAAIEFSVGGDFRTLSYYVANPDLNKDVGVERTYTEQRLILNPVLKLSDAIQLKMRLRALEYIWGDNGVGGLTWGPMIRTNQGYDNTLSSNFEWDRAWVQLFLGKYGSLQIGRQQTDLFHNFSIAEDDTYPRYHYITPVFSLPNENNIMFGILYDKRAEGNIDVGSGDSFAWCPWVFFWNPKITVGYVFFVWDFYGAAENGKNANWIMHDAMINAKIGPVDIKSEWDYLMGDALPWAAVNPGDDIKHTLEFFVDASVPLTTPVVNRASVVVGLFSGVKEAVAGEVTGSIGSNEDWVDEWKIDLILWDQIYNTIRNAWIIRPKIDFVVPNSKFGGFLSACMSFADQEAQYNPGPLPLTTGTEKGIGTEIDLGVNYTLGPRQTIELVLGMLMPGKYFDEANRDTTIGAALKTHIRF